MAHIAGLFIGINQNSCVFSLRSVFGKAFFHNGLI